MAKKILSSITEYKAMCGDCGTKFSYELEDVATNYVGLPRKFVTCPGNNCGAMCAHYDQRM